MIESRKKYVIMPIPIPSVIEYDNSIIIMVINDGKAFFTCLKSTVLIFDIIITPTYINALAAAGDGIKANNGNRNIDIINMIAVTKAVNPVLPPADIPVLLSTYVDIVLVPMKALVMVAALSAYSIFP